MAPINNKVPVILSTVGNESELLIFFGFTPKGFTQADFWALDESNSTDLQTTDFMPIVPNQAEYYATALAADPLLGADVDNLASTLASQVPAVYRSQFLWADYPSPWVDLFHSFHGLDVLFNFDSWPDNQQSLVNFVPPSPSRAALTQQMGAAVKGFIETGDPNTYLGQYGKYWYPWSQGQQTLLWQ
jgi:carboxylesterase type B